MKDKIKPPKSWQNLDTHYLEVLDSPWYKAVSSLQSEFVRESINFYNQENLDFLLLPLTTGSISSPIGLGSDSIPVKINIDGIDTYLADSMQFFLEFGTRIHNKGTYYLAPSFRGEKADARHLCQFFHSEAEIPGTLEDVIQLVERYLKSLAVAFRKNCSETILSVVNNLDHIDQFINLKSIPRCTFDEAIEILEENEDFIDFSNSQFRTINYKGEQALIKHFGGFVWLTHFDHLSVPFYQKASDSTFSKALCADLLMGIGETVGSGERHKTANEVIAALNHHKVSPSEYKWYVEMKEKNEIQTSGFGMGVERYILWLINHDDIRDMQLVPRFNGIKTDF